MSYLGTQPNDVKKNIGLYTPSQILQLTKDGSWGGSLELIQSQTVSGAVSSVVFSNLKESIYNIHLLELVNVVCSADNKAYELEFSNDSGSSFENSNYRWAFSYQKSNGTFLEKKNNSGGDITFIQNVGNASNENLNGYIYMYNLGSSSRFSHATFQMTGITQDPDYISTWGGGLYMVAETINALQIKPSSDNISSGVLNLYGLKML
tara:strand:- start:783 stop:1403 length:621 start_codon:yes stop_codon:yes gene_type:complete